MFLSFCDSALGNSLVFHQAHGGSSLSLGTQNCSAPNAGFRASSPPEVDVSWDFSSCGRNLGYILKLQQEWPFEPPLGSAKSGLLFSYD